MTLVTLNVPHEIRVRLQQESNQSQLVTELLYEHYGKTEFESVEDRDKRLKQEQSNERIQEYREQAAKE